MGSRNVVVFGSGSGSGAATIKDSGKTQQAGKETDALRDAGRKRRAESVSLSFRFSFLYLGWVLGEGREYNADADGHAGTCCGEPWWWEEES